MSSTIAPTHHFTEAVLTTATFNSSEASVSTTVHNHYREFDLHPGITTLIGCGVIAVLLFLYLSAEPALACLRRRRSSFVGKDKSLTSNHNKLEISGRKNLYMDGGKPVSFISQNVVETSFSEEREDGGETKPELPLVSEEQLGSGSAHRSDNLEHIQQSPTIILVPPTPPHK